MPLIDEKSKQDIINQLDWPNLLKELHAYAIAKNKYQPLPSWTSPDEIVNEALLRFLDGTRNWDPKKHPDCAIYLKSVIKSLFSHACEKGLNEKNFAEACSTENVTLVTEPMGAEQSFLYKEALNQMESKLLEDADVLIMFYAMKDGYLDDKELASYLGVDVTEIRNMKKRMRRKLRGQEN